MALLFVICWGKKNGVKNQKDLTTYATMEVENVINYRGSKGSSNGVAAG